MFSSIKYPYKAIWRNSDHDAPVTVIGSYGVLNGQEWLKLESGTGVPKDEIFRPSLKERFKSWLDNRKNGCNLSHVQDHNQSRHRQKEATVRPKTKSPQK